jgi:hypothetical protein
MPDTTYHITLDVLATSLDLEGLKTFVRTSSLFDNWWNHIPGVFLVVSNQDAATISRAMQEYTNGARMLVIRVNPDDSEGWLSLRSWQWVRRRARETTPQSAAE